MDKKVLIILADGFEEMEAVISIDVLRRAGIEVNIASVSKNLYVEGSHKIIIKADVKLAEFNYIPDALILPGGLPGVENLAASESVIELVKKCFMQDKIIAAICAAPAYVLTKAGILNGKKVTGYPGTEGFFDKTTQYLKEDIIVDGNIVTGAGAGTAFYFALKIVDRLLGEKAARRVKQKVLVK